MASPSNVTLLTDGEYENRTSVGDVTEVTTLEPDASGSPIDPWRIYLFGVGGLAVASVGIPCNIMATIVLAHFRSKSPAPFLLACLAISDTVYLTAMAFLENLTIMAAGDVIGQSYADVVKPIYRYMYPVSFITQTGSAYIVVIITLERYIVVARPFLARTWCSIRSSIKAVLAVAAFCILFHTPHYLAYSGEWTYDNATNEENFNFYRNDFGRSDFYVDVFYKWISLTFNFAIPFAVIATCNILTILALRGGGNMLTSDKDHHRQQRETRLTWMIVCMTSIFFLCELLAAMSHALLSGYTAYGQVPDALNKFSAFADFVMIINATINFAIYCFTGRKFRDTFVSLFFQCCAWRWYFQRKKDNDSSFSLSPSGKAVVLSNAVTDTSLISDSSVSNLCAK